MAIVNYIAKRALLSSARLGIIAELSLPVLQLDPNYKLITQESISFSGRIQNVIFRTEDYFYMKTDELGEDTELYLNVLEFAESVKEKEVFSFRDQAGGNTLQALLESPYVKKRIAHGAPVWTFTFTLRRL